MKPFHKSSAPQLDIETAGRILERTFQAAGVQPNHIPLDKLITNCIYRNRKHHFKKIVFAGIIFFLFLLAFLYTKSISAFFTIHKSKTESE